MRLYWLNCDELAIQLDRFISVFLSYKTNNLPAWSRKMSRLTARMVPNRRHFDHYLRKLNLFSPFVFDR